MEPNIPSVIWLIVAPMFIATSESKAGVLSNAFTNCGLLALIPVINAPITVFGIGRLTCACFPMSALDPFLTTTTISPGFTFSESVIDEST